MDFHYLAEIIIGIAIPIFGWLLSSKDRQQEKALDTLQANITDLYGKHETDAAKLATLETKVAENHPQREEVRSMVGDLKGYLDSRFSNIEAAINSLRLK